MKPLLCFLLCCFAFAATQAQNRAPGLFELKPGKSLQLKSGNFVINPSTDSAVVRNGLSLSGNKKPGMYRLRQDGMPCIVPDTKNVAAMPNVFKGEIKTPYVARPPRIPNAVAPEAFSDNGKE